MIDDVWTIKIDGKMISGSLKSMQRRAAAYLSDKPVNTKLVINKADGGCGVMAIRFPNKRYRGQPDRPYTFFCACAR